MPTTKTKSTKAATVPTNKAEVPIKDTNKPTNVVQLPTKEAPARQTEKPTPKQPSLDHVIEVQHSPTMWQYARLAKFVVQRREAGQPAGEAFDAVVKQTVAILNAILAEQLATSKDADVDAATRAAFARLSPKSLERERGPKASE